MYDEVKEIRTIIDASQHILIVQADNPDGDSLGSALALEEFLGNAGKDVTLYCGVDIPVHLRYLSGWDRVSSQLPRAFDASIIVDTATDTLLEQLTLRNQKMWIKNKPCIVIDHHASESTIDYATVACIKEAVATTEVIYELARQLEWEVTPSAADALATGILSDSLGLTTDATTARSIHIVAELVESGASITKLDQARREMYRKEPELVHYKGRLLQRVEYHFDNRVATLEIPWEEIEKYSHAYNPSMLALDDMRLTTNTAVAVAFKHYPDGKVTGKVRTNYGFPIAGKLAEHFGGGGHSYASGFKITDGRRLDEIKSECIRISIELLNELSKETA